MAKSPDSAELKGLKNNTNFLLVNGVSQLLIEANSEGTCERIVDLTSHYLAWISPLIANTQGFKMFALPLNVSACTPGREDKEIFSCTINIPWAKEELWKVVNDGIELKNILTNITNLSSS